MKRTILALAIAAALLLQPAAADAGVRSALRKVGKVVTKPVVYIAVGVAVVVFCARGACN